MLPFGDEVLGERWINCIAEQQSPLLNKSNQARYACCWQRGLFLGFRGVQAGSNAEYVFNVQCSVNTEMLQVKRRMDLAPRRQQVHRHIVTPSWTHHQADRSQGLGLWPPLPLLPISRNSRTFVLWCERSVECSYCFIWINSKSLMFWARTASLNGERRAVPMQVRLEGLASHSPCLVPSLSRTLESALLLSVFLSLF